MIPDYISDMTLPAEACFHGVPSGWGWNTGPLMQAGNDPGGFNHALGWLQVFEAAEGNPAVNTRVQLRNLRYRIYYTKRDKWGGQFAASPKRGCMYVETFLDNATKPAQMRDEPTGSFSVIPGGGYCFHTWTDMDQIDPTDVGGVLVDFEARLVVDDPTKPDDRSMARFCASAGADYWDGKFQHNKGVAEGSPKWVTPAWRSYSMSTMTADQIAAHPVPN